MLNWKYCAKYRWVKIAYNFMAQYKKGYKQRFHIVDSWFIIIFLKIMSIIFKKVGFLGFFITLDALLCAVMMESSYIAGLAKYYAIIFSGLILSYTLHETSHIYSYRKALGGQHLGFVAADRMSVKIVRPQNTTKRTLFATLLGPLVPAVIGMIGLLSTYAAEHKITTEAGIFFLMHAIHIFYLLPFWGDGKSLLRQILWPKLNKQTKGV